ncbi:unnamed protein product [Mytilus edulis]|uniref:SAM domain-containing protein n=1 Tax=Mytilus edulis TaxID=6550 RepID=A0A8S3V4S8_MYTED|nr:unnamed protein product [Mytilus edulis]
MSNDEEITFMASSDRPSDKVRTWAGVMKLSERTTETILELGFENMEAVSLIEADDLAETNMPIGQRKLLLRTVNKTFRKDNSAEIEKVDMQPSKRMTCAQEEGEHGHASGVNKDGGARSLIQDGGAHSVTQDGGNQQEDGYIRAVLQQLSASQKEHAPDPINISYNPNMNNVNSNLSWQDPQIYLKSANMDSKIVYNDISDFVSYDIGGTSMSEERLISDTSGGQLVFKSGPLRPKLESLSLCQWSRANLSIMYKLLSTGELTQTQVLDYLSYTMRFYHLVSSCEFVSVLFFDREYRRLQKQHNFRWGTDIPHLQSVYLRPKALLTKPQASGPSVKLASKQQQALPL